MSSQAHPGFATVGIELSRAARVRAGHSRRSRIGWRVVTLSAVVAIELFVAGAVFAMSIGISGAPRTVTTRQDTAPYVTPAAEAAPTPRPGF